MDHVESKKVMIGNHKDLHFLAMPGFCWAKDGGLGKIITVVAVEGGVQDWTAYHETPWTGSDQFSIASNGDKLPQEVAEEIFPEWAKKFKWRY